MDQECALITRPREDAGPLADALWERGIDSLIEPMLEITNLPGPEIDMESYQAVLLTSANGARALGFRTADRETPVLAVGDATARAAEDHGFINVESAGGNVHTLADLVRRRLDPADGALLHVAGSATAGDLAGSLAAYTVARQVLYEAAPVRALSRRAADALAAGRITMALFYSPRTAATFADVAAPHMGCLHDITAYALSPNVAERLADLPFRTVRVAEEPTQAALLAAIDGDRRR